MGVWEVLGFMALGGLIVYLFDSKADRKYRKGREEMVEIWHGRNPYLRDTSKGHYIAGSVPAHAHRKFGK